MKMDTRGTHSGGETYMRENEMRGRRKRDQIKEKEARGWQRKEDTEEGSVKRRRKK